LAYPVAWIFKFAPFSLAAASIFFNELTIIACFFVAQDWWKNRKLSYTVAILMATSIFTFQFSQYGSNPNFLPLFSVLFFYALEKLFNNPNSKTYQILLAICFGVATQLHAVPLLCLPLILIISIIAGKIKVSWKNALLFLLIVSLLYAPYLDFEFSHGFQNIKALAHIAYNSGFYTPLYERLIEYVGFWFIPIFSVHSFFNVIDLGGPWLFYGFITGLLAILPILKFEKKMNKPILPKVEWTPHKKTVLKYWLFIPSLVIILASSSVNGLRIYYFMMLYPLIFFLLALGLFKLAQTKRVISIAYICTLYFVLQIVQIYVYRNTVAHLLTWVVNN